MSINRLINNRYEVQDVLGQGGLTTTYRAVDTNTGQTCAIKCLSFRKVHEWKTWELFEREANILKHLQHPQIPRYLDFFTLETDADLELYLVQEYVAGKSLAQLVREGRRFNENEVITLALKMCRILDYLHRLSPPIIHRDIKPGNLLLTDEGRLYVIDFGAVRETLLTEYTKMSGATIVGTYGYMPLEQFEGRALPASDIYALGMTLVHLLSHTEPAEFEKTDLQRDVSRYISVSPRFAAVLTKMIAPDYTKRYQAAAELQQDLRRLQDAAPLFKLSLPVRKPAVAAVAFLSLMLFVGGLMSYLARRRQSPESEPVVETVGIVENTPLPDTPSPSPQLSATPGVMAILPTAPVATPTLPPATPTVPLAPSPTPFVTTGTVLQGRLLFDGRPITEVTTNVPSFWVRNDDLNTAPAIQSRSLSGGAFEIGGLSPGNFGVSIYLNANAQNPNGYPGDFYGWENFSVSTGFNPELEVNLRQVIHLTSPQDNNMVLERWDADCMDKFSVYNPVTFRWDTLDFGVEYVYEVITMDCANSYNTIATIVSDVTIGTEVTLTLAPSQFNQCYGFLLDARKDSRPVGTLMTHGSSGVGWDYRFRVK